MRRVCIALLTACGRIGFDGTASDGRLGDGPDGDVTMGDGVPPGFCSASHAITAGGNGDLAVAKVHDGFLAIWGASGGPRSLHTDAALGMPVEQAVPALGSANNVNSIFDEGNVYLASTNDTAAMPSWWSLTYTLSQQSTASGSSGQPFCKDNVVSNAAHSSFVYSDANNNVIGSRYFFGNSFGPSATNYTAAAQVIGVAGADGPDHAHLAWATSSGGTSRECYTGHVIFNANPTMMGVALVVATGCGSQLRAASGSAADDAIAVAWTDNVGSVHAKYKGVQWDFGAGNGVRIKYDGTQFWVAWRSQTAGVHLAKLASGGTFTDYPLPALAPASLESLELVVDGSTVYVVSLESSQLVFVWPC